MPEGMNVEVAHKLNERAESSKGPRGPRERTLEIVEACLLAVVAIATAWSGYQSAKWDGRQAFLYGEASRLRVTAAKEATLGGQERLYDVTTFDSWIGPYVHGDEEVASVFERRFRPEYRVAFDAWMALDPFDNPDAPPGPIFMPEYRNANLDHAAELEAEAAVAFEKGTAARETGDDYVRTTVFLASVLFLAAIAQRFEVMGLRLALLGVAAILLSLALFDLLGYPHL